MASIRTILVPIDGSPPSRAALEHAVALAEQNPSTRVDTLHVEAADAFATGSMTELAPSVREAIQREMDGAYAGAEARLGDRIARRTASGDPLRRIIEIASEAGYELVVIGTHGRVGRLHALLGSVAEGIVRNAPCPVLTVREPGGEYQSFAERLHERPSLAEQLPEPGARHDHT